MDAEAPVAQAIQERSSLLGGVLALGEIESAEAFARKVLDARLKAAGGYLNPTEYDDALSYLIADAWVLWGRYDPAKGTQAFTTFAWRILWRRVASWYRQRFTDTRYRERVTWLSLDDDDALEESDTAAIDSAMFVRINVSRLTPAGRLRFERLARPMVLFDLSLEQLAESRGWSRRKVASELDELRSEVQPMLEASA